MSAGSLVEENFDLVSKTRLNLLQRSAFECYPTVDQLVIAHSDSDIVELLMECAEDGDMKPAREEIVEVRQAIQGEATDVLKSLKDQELARGHNIVRENSTNTLIFMRATSGKCQQLAQELILTAAPSLCNSAQRLVNDYYHKVPEKRVKLSLPRGASALYSELSSSSRMAATLPRVLDGVIPRYPALPRSTTWIPLDCNRIALDDSEPLRALPCSLVDRISENIDLSSLEDLVADLEREVMGEAEEYTVCYIIRRHGGLRDGSRSEVISALSSLLRVSREEVKRSCERVRDGLWYHQTFMPQSSSLKETYQEAYVINPCDVNNYRPLLALGGRDLRLDVDQVENLHSGLGVGLGIRNTSETSELLGCFQAFFCRRCYTYNCNHGVEHPMPYQPPDFPTMFTFPVSTYYLPQDVIRSHRKRKPWPRFVNNLLDMARDIQQGANVPNAERKGDWKGAGFAVESTRDLSNTLLGDFDVVYDSIDGIIDVRNILLSEDDLNDPFLRYVTSALNESSPELPSSSSSSIPQLKRKLPLHHQLYEAAVQDFSGKRFRSTDIPLADCEEALIKHLAALHDDLQLPPGWLGEVYADVKGDNILGRADFVATMLGTRSVDYVTAVLDVLDQEKITGVLNGNAQHGSCDIYSKGGKTKKSKKRVTTDIAKKITQDANSTHRSQYTPCDHDGPCSLALECACKQNSTRCEKYCGCAPTCQNRFPGCTCKFGGCVSNKCPCFIAGRECDPDVCRSCGSYIPGNQRVAVQLCCDNVPSIAKGLRVLCQNIGYSQLHTKKTLVKRSKVHGWGLFLAEEVVEGEFVIEYTGEVISHQEAERRGRVYDLLDRTYLFHLNSEQCIDATQAGSKAKFINHSASNSNLVPRVMLVKGDHTVMLLAMRDIKVGEELFFDYQFAKD